MSDSTAAHEEHTGPIKTPKQLLLTVLFAFVVPVFIIIGLVAYVVSENKPSGSTQAESHALGGRTAQDLDRGVADRLRKVGMVEIRDANRALKTGAEVFTPSAAPVTPPASPVRPRSAMRPPGARASRVVSTRSFSPP